MNETLRCLEERRSIRKYTGEQVPEKILEQILQAGMYAPTGMGLQSPVMVVVQDADMIRRLSALNAEVMGTESDPFYGAPTVIVVLADRSRGTCVEDGSLVIGNLLNAAASLGIGSCWIHRAREVFDGKEGREILAGWGLDPERYIGVGHCILGYAAGTGAGEAEEGWLCDPCLEAWNQARIMYTRMAERCIRKNWHNG